MTTSSILRWTADHPITGRLVVVGCSRRKTSTDQPVPALELYQGGCLPRLRKRVGHRRDLRGRVRILSAEHGLVAADTRLLPYDRPLTAQRAIQLRPVVAARLHGEFTDGGVPHRMLAVAEPPYLRLLTDALAGLHPCPALILLPDPAADWDRAARVLDEWGWP
jgi:hypothetical protein